MPKAPLTEEQRARLEANRQAAAKRLAENAELRRQAELERQRRAVEKSRGAIAASFFVAAKQSGAQLPQPAQHGSSRGRQHFPSAPWIQPAGSSSSSQAADDTAAAPATVGTAPSSSSAGAALCSSAPSVGTK